MATFNKFNQTVEDFADGVYTSSTDQFTVFLTTSSNTPVATNSVLADLTEIAYTNLSSRNLTTVTSSQTSGTFTQLYADLALSASGGDAATFRNVGIFNNTPTSPADPLTGWYDYGSDLTLLDGQTLTLDFTTSTFTIT